MMFVISPKGDIKFICEDNIELSQFPSVKERSVERLSDVEIDEEGFWRVHFRHESEPRPEKFATRKEALEFEVHEAEELMAKGAL
jgi:uncharacterized protein YecE (DUF72 family)